MNPAAGPQHGSGGASWTGPSRKLNRVVRNGQVPYVASNSRRGANIRRAGWPAAFRLDSRRAFYYKHAFRWWVSREEFCAAKSAASSDADRMYRLVRRHWLATRPRTAGSCFSSPIARKPVERAWGLARRHLGPPVPAAPPARRNRPRRPLNPLTPLPAADWALIPQAKAAARRSRPDCGGFLSRICGISRVTWP